MNLIFQLFLPVSGKNRGTQNAILKMIELWKKALEKGDNVRAIFMDLSQIDTKEPTLIMFSVHGLKLNLVCHKGQYLDHFSLTYL